MVDLTREQVTPTDLKVKLADQELRISWRDGRKSVFSAVVLRRKCPCATCRQERDTRNQTLLPVLKQAPPTELKLTDAQLMGNYAIQLIWSDGHSTGIYDYKYLRSLDDAET